MDNIEKMLRDKRPLFPNVAVDARHEDMVNLQKEQIHFNKLLVLGTSILALNILVGIVQEAPAVNEFTKRLLKGSAYCIYGIMFLAGIVLVSEVIKIFRKEMEKKKWK